VQRSPEGVTHLMGARVIDRTSDLERLSEDRQPEDRQPETQLARGDEAATLQPPQGMARHPRNVRILPKSRDFH
jgi:error-prone DNA polymerase